MIRRPPRSTLFPYTTRLSSDLLVAPRPTRKLSRYQHLPGIRLRTRQREQKRRSVVEFAFGANRSPVCKNNVLGDGESQPGAPGFPRASFIHAVETLEKTRQMFGRNPGSEVFDVKFDAGLYYAALRRAGSQNNFFSGRRVLQRILDQVGKNLVDGFAIRIHIAGGR